MSTQKSRWAWPAVLAAHLVAAAPVSAQEADDVTAIIRSLAPIKTQTIATEAQVETDVMGERIVLAPASSVDLEVYFGFDSAALTDRARADLAILGQALSSDALRPYGYLVAGHTDAKGAAAHNQALSERRASAVRDFLIKSFPIAPHRLLAVGWGESRPKDPENPTAGINRRVEVTLIVPEGGFARPATKDTGEAAAPAPDTAAMPQAEPDGNDAGNMAAEAVDSADTSDTAGMETAAPDADPEAQPCEPETIEPACPPAIPLPGAAETDAPLPGTMQKDDQGNITITW